MPRYTLGTYLPELAVPLGIAFRRNTVFPIAVLAAVDKVHCDELADQLQSILLQVHGMLTLVLGVTFELLVWLFPAVPEWFHPRDC